MLPVEAFAEAVAFLPLFDLISLVVTNSLCSTLAAKASNAIRWEEFPGLLFYIANEGIHIFARTDVPTYEGSFVATLAFQSENNMVEFIAAAFPNCIFENVYISGFISNRLIDVIRRVADSIVVSRVLYFRSHMSPKCSLYLLRKFRKVKVSFITPFALLHRSHAQVSV